jgi:asparagine synthase (glutamine-hydrolysing)
MTRLFDQDQKRQLWPAWLGENSMETLKALYEEAASGDPLQQLLSVYQRSWLVEDLLMKADKMSMATSLELRTPFLDYRLVQWANQQPNWVKISRNGGSQLQSKYILRRFCATRVPGSILTRPKRGFPVPAPLALPGLGPGPWISCWGRRVVLRRFRSHCHDG